MTDLSPRQIVAELDRFVVGQTAAKRALAVALRDRERRKRLPPELQREIAAKNILISGPTGVGKTELARRLAQLVDAPFLKTEATKYTEVGYVGRDVEQMVRDLADTAVAMVHRERMVQVRPEAERLATERLLNYLVGAVEGAEQRQYVKRRRRAMARRLAEQELEEQVVEIEVESEETYNSMLEFAAGSGSEELQEQFHELISGLDATRKRLRRLPVREARRVLIAEEANKLIDPEEVLDIAIRRVEESGIVFLDEIDKLISRGGEIGADVSGEGVQRDLLPIVEGSGVATRYGVINTDHILFIAAGAFNRSRPSDLLPELQGRFPIRVEVQDLDRDDFVRILTEPENSPVRQYELLLGTEDVALQVTPDGTGEIARYAALLNARAENLGARRLFGVLERVMADVSFAAADLAGTTVTVDAAYVRERMADVPIEDDVSKYIL